MLMFVWAVKRFKLDLLSYECRGEGTKLIELDRTETFSELRLFPVIRIRGDGKKDGEVEKRVHRALQAARKYSLVANSVKANVVIEPHVQVV